MGPEDRSGDDPEAVGPSLPQGAPDSLWPAGWWRRVCGLLSGVEERRGVFVAGLAAAILAEAVAFLFASTWHVQHVERFTGLSVAPFAVGEVPIPYPEHRLRLLGPVIAWAMGLGGSVYGTLVPVLASFPLLALAYVFIRQRSSIQMGLVSVMLLATTHFTMTSRTLLGYHDSLVYLCCLGALMTRRPLWKGVLLFLALYGDVRAALIFPFVLIWPLDPGDEVPAVRLMAKRAVVCVVALAAWVVSARVLLQLFDYNQILADRMAQVELLGSVSMDGEVFDAIDPYILHLSVFVGFKAAWLFVFVPMWTMGHKNWIMGAYLATALLAVAGPALLVHDVSRAMVLAFPLILLGLVGLWRLNPKVALIAAGTCLAVNLASPFHHGMTWGLWVISYPLPLELIRQIF